MERVGGDVIENISDFVDQTEDTAFVLKEGLKFRSDKLHRPSIISKTSTRHIDLKCEPSIDSIQHRRFEQNVSRENTS